MESESFPLARAYSARRRSDDWAEVPEHFPPPKEDPQTGRACVRKSGPRGLSGEKSGSGEVGKVEASEKEESL